jgi:hypothetical protein
MIDRGRPRWRRALLIALSIGALAAGCRSVGPRTVTADRLDYSAAVAESWKRQTLLNIIKIRYLDTPIFVDVGQIVSGYSLETALSGGAAAFSGSAADSVQVQGSSRFTDRPTITYVPLTGNKFIAGLMTPIPPDALFSAIQSGWPADVLLRQGVTSINGLRNDEGTLGGRGAPDASFLRVVELIRALQVSGALSFRVVRGKAGEQSSLLVFRQDDAPEGAAEMRDELGRLLRLEPGLKEYRLAYGSAAADEGTEVAVLTRSVFHVMGAMAVRAEVPAEHVAEGRAALGTVAKATRADGRRPLIRCTASKPADASVAVRYRRHWFWIDDRDVLAKREFAFIMLLFTMADTGAEPGKPVITIPAQ